MAPTKSFIQNCISFFKKGDFFVWLSGASLLAIVSLLFFLFGVIFINGTNAYWIKSVVTIKMNDGTKVLGEFIKNEINKDNKKIQIQLKQGNRDIYGLDFKWLLQENIKSQAIESGVVVIERKEHGNFYGKLKAIRKNEKELSANQNTWVVYQKLVPVVDELKVEVERLSDLVVANNNRVASAENQIRKMVYHKISEESVRFQSLLKLKKELEKEFDHLVADLGSQIEKTKAYDMVLEEINGEKLYLPMMDIVRIYYPNQLGFFQKCGFYISKVVEVFFDEPRESNTEGGLFPSIVGTVMMVFIMSIVSFPVGVISGIYLREYASEGPVVKMVRIAVNNLAGVPSIVYGIFGLGFFVYFLGGTIDQLFYPEKDVPTFGTGGILWASLTLGLLTVPVVIVSTEEALGAIPKEIKQGSLALGATKFQTLYRVLIPMASPGIMTGFILAMSRAAGEVAPLMITGVVKLAPSLPVNDVYPYVHLDQQFMHLGFHIFDIGFQPPNAEAARPMVYVTTLLLLFIVLIMNSIAIYLRNKMKKSFSIKTF